MRTMLTYPGSKAIANDAPPTTAPVFSECGLCSRATSLPEPQAHPKCTVAQRSYLPSSRCWAGYSLGARGNCVECTSAPRRGGNSGVCIPLLFSVRPSPLASRPARASTLLSLQVQMENVRSAIQLRHTSAKSAWKGGGMAPNVCT